MNEKIVKVNVNDGGSNLPTYATLVKKLYWGGAQCTINNLLYGADFEENVKEWLAPARPIPARGDKFDILKEMMFAASDDETRKPMNGLCVVLNRKEAEKRIIATSDGTRLLVRHNVPEGLYANLETEYIRLCNNGKLLKNEVRAVVIPAKVAAKMCEQKVGKAEPEDFSKPFTIGGTEYYFYRGQDFPAFEPLLGKQYAITSCDGGAEFHARRRLLYAAQNLLHKEYQQPCRMKYDDGMVYMDINLIADCFRMLDRAGETEFRWDLNDPITVMKITTEHYTYLLCPLRGFASANCNCVAPQECRCIDYHEPWLWTQVNGKKYPVNPYYDVLTMEGEDAVEEQKGDAEFEAGDDWAKSHLVVTTIPSPKPKAEAAKADAPAPQKQTEGKRHYTYTKPRAFGEWQVKGELAMNAKGQVTVDGCRVGVQGSPDVEFSEGMELPPQMGEALAAKYWGKVKAYLDKNPAEDGALFQDGYRMIAERDPALLAAAVDYRENQPLRWLFAMVTGLSLTFIRAYDEKVIRLWLGENAEGVELEKRKPGRKPKAEVETNNKGEANDRMGVRGDGGPRGVHGDAVVAAVAD